jgi:branched-chain amino acid transport system ATP-binding protein
LSKDLRIEGLVSGYGPTVVLDGITFSLGAGDTLALLGRNGVGKSTLLATIMGICSVHEGSIFVGGQRVDTAPAHKRVALGLGYVPQEREIFRSLTVEENLLVARVASGWAVGQVYGLFPRLEERRANTANKLSGGEQQMLAIGRALVGDPSVLLLDEPLEGLAPVIVESLLEALRVVQRETRMTMILVEQKADLALSITERVIVLDRGRIIHDGKSSDLAGNEAAQAKLLSVADAGRELQS